MPRNLYQWHSLRTVHMRNHRRLFCFRIQMIYKPPPDASAFALPFHLDSYSPLSTFTFVIYCRRRHRRRRCRSHAARMCGIIGLFRQEGPASTELYEGLLMLQHRGQDSAGMVTFDGERFVEKKDNGLVANIFNKESLEELEAWAGTGLHPTRPCSRSIPSMCSRVWSL